MRGKRVTVGVDLGGTKLLGAVVDEAGAVSSLLRWPGRVRQYDRALAAIASLVGRLEGAADERDETVVAVGVAAAAFLDADREHVRDATNLLGWGGRPFRADITARLGLPVVVENDGNAAAWGEYAHGAAAGEPCVVMATVGTGIGGGIVIDDRLVAGGSGVAAELGHVQVVPDGRPCGCGAAGCLEEYASGTALTRSVRAAAAADPAGASRLLALAGGDPEGIDGPLITALAIDGDPAARGALAELGTWLGVGLAQVATMLDPSIVIVGGGLAGAAGELIIRPACDAYRARASLRAPAPVRAAALGNTAGLVGAAALARSAEHSRTAQPARDRNTTYAK
jgi:glucokinase